jgi:DNA processing protein
MSMMYHKMRPRSALYPPLLLHISSPADPLYVRGDHRVLVNPAIAIVGTRHPTSYGLRVAAHLATGLVRAGFTVVSGMALGIDAAAHHAALVAGGQTIAVLPSSLDDLSIYPPSNIHLAKSIADHGALVSEYAHRSSIHKYHFLRRNRLIAGISAGTVVVEAREKSGALITARHAIEQNRPVFVVPGSIYEECSYGPLHLLREGATPIRSVEDIINDEQVHALLPSFPHQPIAMQASATSLLLSKKEQLVFSCLTNQPKFIDLIRRQTKLSVEDILSTVTVLEQHGLVVTSNGYVSRAPLS